MFILFLLVAEMENKITHNNISENNVWREKNTVSNSKYCRQGGKYMELATQTISQRNE